MRFHHMAIMVSDLEAAIALWRDVLGFTLELQTMIPDRVGSALLDEVFEAKGASSRMAILRSSGNALIELQQPVNPAIERTPPENLRYRHTGIHELGLLVDDIDYWFRRVREAGYKTQTEYIWSAGEVGRSFMFFDPDGNLIQLWQNTRDGSFAHLDITDDTMEEGCEESQR